MIQCIESGEVKSYFFLIRPDGSIYSYCIDLSNCPVVLLTIVQGQMLLDDKVGGFIIAFRFNHKNIVLQEEGLSPSE